MNSRTLPLRTAVVVLALSIGLSTPAHAVPAADPPSPSPAGTSRQVTLITGDRASVAGDRVGIEPGPGRSHVTFRVLRSGGSVTVIPSDVSGDVASGKLDRRLFDLTGLLEARYDDAASPSIPLIVTYADRAKRSAPAGTSTTRDLPSINGAAVKVAKTDAATFLSGLKAARSAGVRKIWLDGKRKAALDSSVPQIGAPAAWDAGFTGKDIPVAVVDTGVDSTHPDLADRLAGTRDFSGEGPEDLNGHGTHVASIIAGTNAKYRGVAPDAKIHSAKACDRYGDCSETAILAAMEWAATEVKARVVNMSLGREDTPELDPLEEAVNRLTEQTGTLFVIAAGNSGKPKTVSSPGSAEAALTVGAVDKQDKLADFSSRGPRVGDEGLKPDVTAPGVDITAARNGGGHQALSGTSMATPHTAGAAALLAQQHPDWKAADLKAALMASAKPLDGLTPFEQGTGRVDVAKAIKQPAVAVPGSLAFGVALWPHADDKPVTKQLTYRNLGDQPLTLKLTPTMTGPDGKPGPESAIKLSATEVTVPAGGTTTVDVTSDTRHDGPDGAYSGRVTATGPGVTLTTALTVTKEVESYTVDVTMIPPGSNPDSLSSASLYRYEDGLHDFFPIDGTTKRRLPKGQYLADGYHLTDFGPEGEVHLAVQQNLTVDGDTPITFDMRKNKPFDLTVPAPDAKPLFAELSYWAGSPQQYSAQIFSHEPAKLFSSQFGEQLSRGKFSAFFHSQWARADAEGNVDRSPYLYSTMNRFAEFPTGLTRAVRPGDLTIVDQTLNHTSHADAATAVVALVPGFTWASLGGFFGIGYQLPAERRLLVDKGDTAWATDLAEGENGQATSVSYGEWRTYPAGRVTKEQVNAGAFTPTPLAATRSGDQLNIRLSLTTDATGARGVFSAADSQSTRLLRDGTELARSDDYRTLNASGLPAGAAKYTLESALDRSSTAKFSTKVDARWTFTSAAADKTLPLVGVRYQPRVDRNNTVARTAVTSLPVIVTPVRGGQLPAIRAVTVHYSGDDGATWKKASLVQTTTGQYRAVFPTPDNAKTISLKFHATTAGGATADLTTIAAYHLR